MERDICCLVLSASVRVTQPFVDDTCASRGMFGEDPPPPPRPAAAKSVASRPPIENEGPEDAELTVGGRAGSLSAKSAEEETDKVLLRNICASVEVHKSVLPDMLCVHDGLER